MILPTFNERFERYCGENQFSIQEFVLEESIFLIPVFDWMNFESFHKLMMELRAGKDKSPELPIDRIKTIYTKYISTVVQLLRENDIRTPVIVRRGDNRKDFNVPTIVKSVKILPQKKSRYILPLEYDRFWRHYVNKVDGVDIHHDRKEEKLVWRGATTGGFLSGSGRNTFRHSLAKRFDELSGHNIGFSQIAADTERDCDIPLTRLKDMVRGRLSLKQQLKYKYLLSLEGNDVASGLKWMLYSNSTVLMPKPTCESWACESFLEEFVHYVPVNKDLSDLNAKVDWCQSNPKQAKLIAQNGRKFISSFLCKETEEKLANEVIRAISSSCIIKLSDSLQEKIQASSKVLSPHHSGR